MNTPAQISRVYVYSLEQDKSFPVTDGLTEATEPVFDAGGKYLYFLGVERHRHEQARLQPVGGRQPAAAVVAQPGGAEEGPAAPVPARERRGEGRGRAARRRRAKDEPKERTPRSRSTSTGLDQRILSFPLPPGNYAGLQAGRGGPALLPRPRRSRRGGGGRGGGAGGGATLHRYDLERASATRRAGRRAAATN